MIEPQDRDVEERLRHYAPIAPPARLRARVLAGATRPASSRGAWWLAAAAALAAVVFHVLASATYAEIHADVSRTDEAVRSQRIERLAADLGGGAAARAAAVHWVQLEEQMADRTHAAPDTGDSQ
jgi:hypothetical protein